MLQLPFYCVVLCIIYMWLARVVQMLVTVCTSTNLFKIRNTIH